MSDECELDLALCMSHLTDREKFVIRMRYFEQKTQQEIAPEIGTKRERVRQIEAKAVRKLRCQAPAYILKYGAKAYVEMRIEERVSQIVQSRESALEAAYQQKMEELRLGKEVYEFVRGKADAMSMTIDELDLSVRAHNCLKRCGCKTIRDVVVNHPTYDDAMKIRNLGRKSFEEIVEKLKSHGIDWPREVQ